MGSGIWKLVLKYLIPNTKFQILIYKMRSHLLTPHKTAKALAAQPLFEKDLPPLRPIFHAGFDEIFFVALILSAFIFASVSFWITKEIFGEI